MTQSKCPPNLNFALVRLKESPGLSKKVLIPSKLTTLKKNITSLFKLNQPIQSLYSEDGHQIQFLHEIVAGEVILASTFDGEMQSVSGVPHPHSPAIIKVSPVSGKMAPSSRPQSRQNQREYETFGLSPNIVTIGGNSPLLRDQARLHHTMRDLRGLRRNNEEKETEEERLRRQKLKELEKYAEKLPDSLKRLFNVLDEENSWINDIMPLINSLPVEERVLLVDAEKANQEQNEFWLCNLDKMMDNVFQVDVPQRFVAKDDIKQFSSQIIENHRFTAAGECSYNMRCVIVGPRKSGKTNFLKHLGMKIAQEFVRNGTNFHKFIVAFDMKKLATSLVDYTQFYVEMVDVVCNALATQKPILAKLVRTDIRPFLLSVMNSDPPNFRKTLLNGHEFKELFINLQGIGELLNLFWNDSSCLAQWYTNTSLLPVLVAAAAGYDETFFIIDHLDYCDQNFISYGRFSDASDTVFVSEYFKFALSNSNYIAACEDTSKLYTLLVDVDDTFTYAPFEFISMDEIQSDAAKNSNLIVTINGLETPLTIGPEICSGIPAYISLWNQVIEFVSNASNASNEEAEDMALLAVSQVQQLLDLCFVVDENADSPLTSITALDVKLK